MENLLIECSMANLVCLNVGTRRIGLNLILSKCTLPGVPAMFPWLLVLTLLILLIQCEGFSRSKAACSKKLRVSDDKHDNHVEFYFKMYDVLSHTIVRHKQTTSGAGRRAAGSSLKCRQPPPCLGDTDDYKFEVVRPKESHPRPFHT